ncbi:MAG: hypothetical protein RL699_1250 [Bacteroidota bacterium]|jgi:4-hydroxybenzoate polyprenyltransferase
MKTTLYKTALLVIALVGFSMTTYAYDDYSDDAQLLDGGFVENANSTSNPDAPGGDPGVAPINDYLPLLLLGGIALGFVYYRKRQTV